MRQDWLVRAAVTLEVRAAVTLEEAAVAQVAAGFAV